MIIDDREDVWSGKNNHLSVHNTNGSSATPTGSNDCKQLLLARPFIYFNAFNTNNNVIVEANHASGPMHATGTGSAPGGVSSNGQSAPMTPVIALSGEFPGRIIKTISQSSNEYSGADDQLVRCLDIVREIHRRYYNITSTSNSSSSDGSGSSGQPHFLKNITEKITSRNVTNTSDNNNNNRTNSSSSSNKKASPTANSVAISPRRRSVANILTEMKNTVLAGEFLFYDWMFV